MVHRNIYVVGAQSTGKTTLVRALHDRFSAPRKQTCQSVSMEDPSGTDYGFSSHKLISEVARSVAQQANIGRFDIRNSQQKCLELQELILDAPYEAENAAGTFFISDRSGVDPLAYASFHTQGEQMQRLLMKSEWQLLRDRLRNSFVIIIEPVPKLLEDDGTRLLPLDKKEWWAFHRHFAT